MEQGVIDSILKVASEAKNVDEEISEGLYQIAEYIKSVKTSKVDKEAIQRKEAKLLNVGDIVVCVDNFAPLFKGRRYKIYDTSIPGFIAVKELTGEDVGIFAVNRFVRDNDEQ